MNKIVGIQFKPHGKIHNFDSGHFVLQRGDKVMVITEEGPALGWVATEPKTIFPQIPQTPLIKVFRLATQEELQQFEENSRLEKGVYEYCFERIKARELPMCLVGVERRFDGSKFVVFFTADGRVDFRALVKDLVKHFRTRIEMRQIGVRHQAKMVGGLGTCGRPLCCASFLENFDPVTIKMAKGQNLSLNPNKISGMCGRLMCCLSYEHSFYENIKKTLPKVGNKIETEHGEARVVRQNVLTETLTVALESGEELVVPVDKISPPRTPRKKNPKEK